ncbi:hypothetical protein XELAEV_18028326mg [Xenopus laevis]|uniref:Uncharacterized protein n=1 Tax=Xenopus laevis TaxID=8355 RepID=A0A974CZ75_XENLA|nr:hypothetical protein XELAEV_18028326mg [Xenopus laevis]
MPTDSFLVTMEVKSLYTLIPHDQGIEEDIKHSHLLEPTLTRNLFRFENAFYLQISGDNQTEWSAEERRALEDLCNLLEDNEQTRTIIKVLGIGNLTESASIYVDEVLKSFVTSLPSFVQDTIDVICQLDGISIEKNHFPACLDIESLYTSILHEVGLEAVTETLKQRGKQYSDHNSFVKVVGKYQIRGTEMGSTCAPTYANLYLGWWESRVVFEERLKEYIQLIPLWLRYMMMMYYLYGLVHRNNFLNLWKNLIQTSSI